MKKLLGRLTGEPGSEGRKGLWYAYAGVWDTDTTSVTNTSTQGWYVKYGDKWYMNVMAADSPNTNTPGGSGWEEMKSEFKYYIARAYFGDYAHLGSFIINGDWMISQYGTVNGSFSTNYSAFDPSNPNNNTGSNFIPNFAVNGLTGKTYQQNAYVKGQIYADSGKIGNFEILNGHLRSTDNMLTLEGTPPDDYALLNVVGHGKIEKFSVGWPSSIDNTRSFCLCTGSSFTLPTSNEVLYGHVIFFKAINTDCTVYAPSGAKIMSAYDTALRDSFSVGTGSNIFVLMGPRYGALGGDEVWIRFVYSG